jgi:hypothetical protein
MFFSSGRVSIISKSNSSGTIPIRISLTLPQQETILPHLFLFFLLFQYFFWKTAVVNHLSLPFPESVTLIRDGGKALKIL